jgi:hypothetical protein
MLRGMGFMQPRPSKVRSVSISSSIFSDVRCDLISRNDPISIHINVESYRSCQWTNKISVLHWGPFEPSPEDRCVHTHMYSHIGMCVRYNTELDVPVQWLPCFWACQSPLQFSLLTSRWILHLHLMTSCYSPQSPNFWSEPEDTLLSWPSD